MEKLFNELIQHTIQLITPLIRKLARHLVLALFLLLYLVAFWFLFFTKGIYADGHFYRKSANLTTVTYTCRSPFAEHKTITLEKQVDGAVITIDGEYELTVANNGSILLENGTFTEDTLPDVDWNRIADQSAERNRGFGEKWWIATLVIMAAALFVNRYSTEVYNFFNRSKAANESYYLWVGRASKAICIIGLIYLIIPL